MYIYIYIEYIYIYIYIYIYRERERERERHFKMVMQCLYSQRLSKLIAHNSNYHLKTCRSVFGVSTFRRFAFPRTVVAVGAAVAAPHHRPELKLRRSTLNNNVVDAFFSPSAGRAYSGSIPLPPASAWLPNMLILSHFTFLKKKKLFLFSLNL